MGNVRGPQAKNLDFSGTFAKLSRNFTRALPRSRKIYKHLHSPSEQLQIVTSLSRLCIPKLLVYNNGNKNRRILYALPGLNTEILRLQFISLWHTKTLPPTSSTEGLPYVSILYQFGRKENHESAKPSINLSREKKKSQTSSRIILITSAKLFYIKFLTRGFRSTPIYYTYK